MISGLDYIMSLFLHLYPLRDKLDPVYIVSKLDLVGFIYAQYQSAKDRWDDLNFYAIWNMIYGLSLDQKAEGIW